MATAKWNGETIAESDKTIMIEGNHYFPEDSVKMDLLSKTEHHTVCHWKGDASYYSINVNGEINENGAWYYPAPKDGSVDRVGEDFANYVAFWNGVEVSE